MQYIVKIKNMPGILDHVAVLYECSAHPSPLPGLPTHILTATATGACTSWTSLSFLNGIAEHVLSHARRRDHRAVHDRLRPRASRDC